MILSLEFSGGTRRAGEMEKNTILLRGNKSVKG